MAIIIDLFTRKVLAINPGETDSGLNPNWYQDLKARFKARFGDNFPKHFKGVMANPQSQPYMYGDTHNVKYKTDTDYFNKPMPAPCQVTVDSCKRVKGVLTLGSQCEKGIDEPLAWIDRKYQVTLNFLKSLPNGTKLNIFTRSDLVACEEYVNELKRLDVQVVILYTCLDDNLNRINEPGAPSYGRRLEACNKLNECGVKSEIRMHGIPRSKCRKVVA